MNTHTNNHDSVAKKSAPALRLATKTVRAAKKKATSVARSVDRKAHAYVAASEGRFNKMARNTFEWIKQNPKTATGVLLGTGVLVGVFAGTKFGRAALFSLGGFVAATATAAVKRFS